MTKGLRAGHKIIWLGLTLAIIGVGGFLLINRPIEAINPAMEQEQTKVGDSLSVVQNDILAIELFTYSEYKNKMLIELKEPLKSASGQLYSLSDDNKGVWIGNLNEKGSYHFVIPIDADGIMVYDGIKKEELLKVKF